MKKGPNNPTKIANISNGKNIATKACLYFKTKYNIITKIMNVILIPPNYFF